MQEERQMGRWTSCRSRLLGPGWLGPELPLGPGWALGLGWLGLEWAAGTGGGCSTRVARAQTWGTRWQQRLDKTCRRGMLFWRKDRLSGLFLWDLPALGSSFYGLSALELRIYWHGLLPLGEPGTDLFEVLNLYCLLCSVINALILKDSVRVARADVLPLLTDPCADLMLCDSHRNMLLTPILVPQVQGSWSAH